MSKFKLLNIALAFFIVFSLVISGADQAKAMPMDPMDPSKVPHYFGPNPNWANSPFTLPDAQVVITGNGTGATAEATVGAGGGITAITVTNGGPGHSRATIAIFGFATEA